MVAKIWHAAGHLQNSWAAGVPHVPGFRDLPLGMEAEMLMEGCEHLAEAECFLEADLFNKLLVRADILEDQPNRSPATILFTKRHQTRQQYDCRSIHMSYLGPSFEKLHRGML